MNKAISVWLTMEDGASKGKAILQKRSQKNKTFPFICQSAWAGKVELGEAIERAIARECKEELGDSFYKSFNFESLKDVGKGTFVYQGADWEMYNYFSTINEALFKLIKLHDEALPEFVIVGAEDEIYPFSSGKDPKNNVVLFDEQYKLLKNILNGN